MANTIQIKRGNSAPPAGTLRDGELGFDKANDQLYIGNGTEQISLIPKSAADVGAVPTSRTVNGKALSSNITLSASDVGARASTWVPSISDLGVTATAAELNKLDGVTATTAELNYVDGVTSNIQTQLNAKVPTTRTVNGKALSGNISLTASDVGARSDTWMPTASEVGAAEEWHTHPVSEVTGAAEEGHTHTADEVGARPSTWPPTPEGIGAARDFGFIESTEYPGCYYREVTTTVDHGTITEKEWLNPPMRNDVVYRTTKRFQNNRAVYVVNSHMGSISKGATKSISINCTQATNVNGTEYVLWLGYDAVFHSRFDCFDMDTNKTMWSGVSGYCYSGGGGVVYAGLTASEGSLSETMDAWARVYVEFTTNGWIF